MPTCQGASRCCVHRPGCTRDAVPEEAGGTKVCDSLLVSAKCPLAVVLLVGPLPGGWPSLTEPCGGSSSPLKGWLLAGILNALGIRPLLQN